MTQPRKRLKKLIQQTHTQVLNLISEIDWNTGYDEAKESELGAINSNLSRVRIRLAMQAWIQQSLLKDADTELHQNLTQIRKLLVLFKALKQDSNKPFESLLTPTERIDSETLELLNQYNSSYRNVFLKFHENEIINILSSKQLNTKLPELAVISKTLENVKKMHANPDKYLEKPLIAEAQEKPQSKLKKYLTRASLVISGILIAAMAIKLLPLTALGMTIMHIAMYCTTGVGILGYAEEKYAQYKEKSANKKKIESLQTYKTEVTAMSNFFSSRPKTPIQVNENPTPVRTRVRSLSS